MFFCRHCSRLSALLFSIVTHDLDTTILTVQLAFLMADIFASFGVLSLSRLRAYTLEDATFYTCSYLYTVLVIYHFKCEMLLLAWF